MRLVSLTLLLAAAVFAQAPPSGTDQQASPSAEPAAPPQNYQRSPVLTPEERARNIEKLKNELQASKAAHVVATAVPVVTAGKAALGRPCSIPLLDAMPRNAQAIDRPMVMPAPPNPARFTMRLITPPAPPCPEADWRNGPAPTP